MAIILKECNAWLQQLSRRLRWKGVHCVAEGVLFEESLTRSRHSPPNVPRRNRTEGCAKFSGLRGKGSKPQRELRFAKDAKRGRAADYCRGRREALTATASSQGERSNLCAPAPLVSRRRTPLLSICESVRRRARRGARRRGRRNIPGWRPPV